MVNKIKKAIKLFDMFGKNVNLNIKNNKHLKSTFGGIVSLFFYLGVLVISGYSLNDYVNNNPPNVVLTNNYRNLSKIDNVSIYNFNMSFAMYTDFGSIEFYNMKIHDYSLLQTNEVKVFPTYEGRNITLGAYVLCDKIPPNTYSPEFEQILYYVHRNRTICIDYSLDNVTSGGDFLKLGDQYWTKGGFTLDLCELYPNQCTNSSYLKEVSSVDYAYKFSTLLESYFVNFTAKSGYSNHLAVEYFDIDLSKDVSYTITYTKNTIQTDNNFIYNFIKPDENIFYTTKTSAIFIERQGPVNLLKIVFNYIYDKNEVIYYRSYEHFDSTLASAFSLIQILYYFNMILIEFFNYGYLENKIINKIIKFKNEQDLNNNIEISHKKIGHFSILTMLLP